MAVVTGACSDDGEPASGATDTSESTAPPAADPDFLAADVQVRAEDITFPQRAYDAAPGEIAIGYVNEGAIYHTLALEDGGGDGVEGWSRLEVRKRGDVAVGTITLESGEYVLYCDVPGHRGNGMEAALTVTAPEETTG